MIHEDATTGKWCWRRPTPGARPALVAATAVRLLAARDYTSDQLREAVVDAVRRLPPSTRQDLDTGDLPPARLLVAWLATTGLLRPAGPDGRLRCEASAGLRSDLVLAAAVTAAGAPLSTADLAVALREAGYAPSTVVQLARFAPVLRRVTRDSYALR